MGTRKGCSTTTSTKPHCVWCCGAYHWPDGCWPSPSDWPTLSPGNFEKTGEQEPVWLGSLLQWHGVDQETVEASCPCFAPKRSEYRSGPFKILWTIRQSAEQAAWLFDSTSQTNQGMGFWKHGGSNTTSLRFYLDQKLLNVSLQSWLKQPDLSPLKDLAPKDRLGPIWWACFWQSWVSPFPSLPSPISFHAAVCCRIVPWTSSRHSHGPGTQHNPQIRITSALQVQTNINCTRDHVSWLSTYCPWISFRKPKNAQPQESETPWEAACSRSIS